MISNTCQMSSRGALQRRACQVCADHIRTFNTDCQLPRWLLTPFPKKKAFWITVLLYWLINCRLNLFRVGACPGLRSGASWELLALGGKVRQVGLSQQAESALMFSLRRAASLGVWCAAGSVSASKATKVTFKVPYRVHFGQQLGIVGSAEQLGTFPPLQLCCLCAAARCLDVQHAARAPEPAQRAA